MASRASCFLIWPSKFLLGWPSWISYQKDFSYFWSTCHPDTSYQVLSQWTFLFWRRRSKWTFKMATVAVITISIWNNLTYFWSTSLPDAFYQVSSQWTFWFRKRSKNYIFKMAATWPSWLSDQKQFSYIWSTSRPGASYKFQVYSPYGPGEGVKNRFSRWPPCGHLGFPIVMI